jgi:V8-like Glu-specific endopeptidase
MAARIVRPYRQLPLALLCLLCACDSPEGPPPEPGNEAWRADPTHYGGEEGAPSDEPPMQEPDFLAEVAAESPPPDRYDFLGYVKLEGSGYWIHDEEPAESVTALLEKHGIDPTDPDQGIVNPPIDSKDHDAGRMIVVSADGRMFLEREDAFVERLLEIQASPEAWVSYLEDEIPPPPDDGSIGEVDEPSFRDGIWYSDTRDLVASPSSYPWRAVGVQMFKHEAGNEWAVSDWDRYGSGTMIGPRTVLTAAHVLLEGNIVHIMAAAAGAHGKSFSSDGDPGPGYSTNAKYPWGIRRAVWYMWPLAHYAEDEWKYDYAAIALQDLSWSPGFIRFGHNSTTWLNYRYYNSSGYPQDIFDCAASPVDSGECDGWMYSAFDQVREVWSYTARHRLDNQPGQSGSGIYVYRENTGDRVEYFIQVAACEGSGPDCGLGKRLREGSTSSICNVVNDFPSSYWPGQGGC